MAIKSVLQQTFREFDCCSWMMVRAMEVCGLPKASTIPVFKFFRMERILGLPTRLNQSVQMAKGKYYARMDADDICFPDRLMKQVDYLEKNQDTDLVGCGAVVFDNEGDAIGLFPMHIAHEQIVSNPLKGFYLPHPTWMGKTEWFRKYPYKNQASKHKIRNYSYVVTDPAILPV